MDVRKKYVLFIAVILSWMGFMYTSKSLISFDNLDEHPISTVLCPKLRINNQEEEKGRLKDIRQTAVTAIVPRAWEKFPGKTWRGLSLPVITAEPWGRLGNVMGEYASLYALGRSYNTTVRLNPDMKFYLRKIFPKLSMPLVPGKYVKFDWTPIRGVSLRNYAQAEAAAAGLLGPKLFRIKDWPFEIQLFNAYRDDIRREFTFTTNVIKEVRQFITEEIGKLVQKKKKTTNSPVLVGIHIRRKDYLQFIQKSYQGHIPGMAYYERAMAYYRKKYPEVIFVVGSDDMLFVKQHFSGRDDVIFGPGSTREIDMAALASCNHSIISLGSYGFWTGYLAGGEVLYPNISFGVPYQFSKEWYETAKLDFFTPVSAED